MSSSERRVRQELFADPFQAKLAGIFGDRPKGQPPLPLAQLVLVTLLQAYTWASDDEAIEDLTMDPHRQLVYDCLDCAQPAVPKAVLVSFRAALIVHGHADRELCHRMGEAGRLKVEREFGLDRLVSETLAAYRAASWRYS
jgi:hypothetical protein